MSAKSVIAHPNFTTLWSFGGSSTQLAGYVENAFYNGFGRHVCQLQRMTLKFCKYLPNSRGLREWIQDEVVDFSRQNPGVVVYLKPRRHKSPVMVCEYLNNTYHWMSFNKMSKREISWWIDYHLTRSGQPVMRFIKTFQTERPSVQGPWTPFLNKPTELNISTYPFAERGLHKSHVPTATEQLEEIFKEGRVKGFILENHPREVDEDDHEDDEPAIEINDPNIKEFLKRNMD